MIDRFLAKVFGTQHERDIKKLAPRVERINALEPAMQALSDEALREVEMSTPSWKAGWPVNGSARRPKPDVGAPWTGQTVGVAAMRAERREN